MRSWKLWFWIGAAAAFAGSAPGGGLDRDAVVEKHILPIIEADLIESAVVGIALDGEVSYHPIGTLGDGSGAAPTKDTLYEIGSISKVITGVFFADAVRRGEVARDTPIDDLLPEGVDAPDIDGVEVTLEHLATHTSGWPTAPVNLRPSDPARPFKGYTEDRMYRYADQALPGSTPGTTHEYSNYGYGLLGTLIARRVGDAYEALVTRRVLEPLGIEDMMITLGEGAPARLAPPMSEGRPSANWETMGPMNPAGMWVADAEAVLNFIRANLRHGDEPIHRSLEISRTTLLEGGGGMPPMRWGWFVGGDGDSLWHNGMTGGYASFSAINTLRNAAVVVLANGTTPLVTRAGDNIFHELLGVRRPPVEIDGSDRVSEEAAAPLVGTYRSGSGHELIVTHEVGRLFARLKGQASLKIVPTGEPRRYRYTGVEAELAFAEPEGGASPAVTLYQNGYEIECERVE